MMRNALMWIMVIFFGTLTTGCGVAHETTPSSLPRNNTVAVSSASNNTVNAVGTEAQSPVHNTTTHVSSRSTTKKVTTRTTKKPTETTKPQNQTRPKTTTSVSKPTTNTKTTTAPHPTTTTVKPTTNTTSSSRGTANNTTTTAPEPAPSGIDTTATQQMNDSYSFDSGVNGAYQGEKAPYFSSVVEEMSEGKLTASQAKSTLLNMPQWQEKDPTLPAPNQMAIWQIHDVEALVYQIDAPFSISTASAPINDQAHLSDGLWAKVSVYYNASTHKYTVAYLEIGFTEYTLS